MNPNAGRASIFAVAGGYLIYLAYEMLQNLLNDVPTTMPQALLILFIGLFTVIGIGLLVLAWKVWRQGRLDPDRNPVELEAQETGDGENSPEK